MRFSHSRCPLDLNQPLQPQELLDLPLLQQSTRPDAWRRWFEGQGIEAPAAVAGLRYELFSMQAAAAMAGLGVALMPTLLVQQELARGELVVACAAPMRGERAYCLVQPDGPERAALTSFREWLVQECEAGKVLTPSPPPAPLP